MSVLGTRQSWQNIINRLFAKVFLSHGLTQIFKDFKNPCKFVKSVAEKNQSLVYLTTYARVLIKKLPSGFNPDGSDR